MDDYKSFLRDENGEKIINPNYDPSSTYITRDLRNEWNAVGLIGQVPVTKGQQIGDNWILIKNISPTVDLYLVK